MDTFVVIITTIISAGLPTTITILASLWQNRQSKKHSAKQSILQMIMEDQMSWELFRKLPTNHENILNEYDVYHKNGGNGEITEKVEAYKIWYRDIEASLKDQK